MRRSLLPLPLFFFLIMPRTFGDSLENEFPKVPFDRYQLHDEMTETLEKWNELYPNLTKLHLIGRSVLGKELWVLEVFQGWP